MAGGDENISIPNIHATNPTLPALTLSHHRLAVYPPGATYGPRTLRDHQLVWIIEGDTEWTCDGRRHQAPPGTVILARPGMHDAYRWDPFHTTRHAYVHFTVRRRGGLPPAAEWPLIAHVSDDDVVPTLFRHLLHVSSRRPPGWELLAAGAAGQLLAAFVLGATAIERLPSGTPDPIERLALGLRARWRGGETTAPSLAEMAEAAAVSPTHLCRLFDAHVGCGPVEAVRLLRLDRAASMLTGTNMTVNEIARVTGFANQFHFARAFRAAYGMPPRVYRTAGAPASAPGTPHGLRRFGALIGLGP